ncbi:hypothetical protein GQX74_014017 [Glossina fuscipes]|nr:hypothetical protein GQX74_014017 [Glossina fuscipes]
MSAKTGNKGTPQGAQGATGDSPEVLPDPFKRSIRIQRSPEQIAGQHTQMRSQFSPPILQEESLMMREGENSFVELGKKIGELIEMMAPTPSAPARRTIHQPRRDSVDMLAVLHKKAAKELGNKMPKKAITRVLEYQQCALPQRERDYNYVLGNAVGRKRNQMDIRSDIFLQAVNVLWKLFESAPYAVDIFNQTVLMESFIRCLDFSVYGLNIAISVAQFFLVVSENNPK